MSARTIAKEAVYGLAHALDLPAYGRRSRRDALTVLTYHSFGPAEEHPYLFRLPPARLAAQLDHLASRYDVVSLEEGLQRIERGEAAQSARAMAAITVDDGYADNYEHLFPALHARRLPATIFLATDYLDSGRLPWPTRIGYLIRFATKDRLSSPIELSLATAEARIAAGRALRQHFSRLDSEERDAALVELEAALAPAGCAPLRPLSWDQVRDMQAGGVRFGSHTRFHGWLDRVSPGEVDAELTQSRARLEAETGAPCRIIAYPNGNWSENVLEATARAGYAYALTQDPGVNRRDGMRPLALARIEVPYNEGLGAFACRVGGIAF